MIADSDRLPHSTPTVALETDEKLAQTSQRKAGTHRELEKWNDNSVSFPQDLGDSLDQVSEKMRILVGGNLYLEYSFQGIGYPVDDMFRHNEMISGQKSTYHEDMSQYT